MPWLVDFRLVVLTAGTLLPFFWMLVILGHRRQRNFERVFFFLCLALTLFFGSSLLALNAVLFYGSTPPRGLLRFAWTFLWVGLWLLPTLTVHLHIEHASLQGLLLRARWKWLWLAVAYLPALLVLPQFLATISRRPLVFGQPVDTLGRAFALWLLIALLASGYWQLRFAIRAANPEQRAFHKVTLCCFAIIFVGLCAVSYAPWLRQTGTAQLLTTIVLAAALFPLGLLVRNVERLNFLEIARQRNLMYALFGIFVALLYLSFVRRAGQWLEAYLPPEATAAILLFLPVIFFEPLQRLIRGLLRRTAQTEVDRAQKLMGAVNEVARSGDLEKLRTFAENWIAERLQLAEVHLHLESNDSALNPEQVRHSPSGESFEVRRAGRYIGTLTVRSHGAMISGETFGALEFLCEQLPAAIDLCRLIQEKLQLERELAERERLALVGQMAASISHNLKNPLGSIKTILQVQMENPELPASLKQETQMVLDEIRRLSEKLNQLLQFSRPAAPMRSTSEHCDINQIAENVANVFRRDAAQRGITLELDLKPLLLQVAANPEVTNDILSNLLVNALEAAPSGGHVCLAVDSCNGHARISVEDDGAGIPPQMKSKILQPFFTTKARGTGLGLAIVARRLEELGGKLEVESPVRNNRGSCFRVLLPLAAKETR
jgi:signal transduction histidine kinase